MLSNHTGNMARAALQRRRSVCSSGGACLVFCKETKYFSSQGFLLLPLPGPARRLETAGAAGNGMNEQRPGNNQG